MSRRQKWALIALALVLGLLMDFAMAKAGSPSSLWVWRDVLGVIR